MNNYSNKELRAFATRAARGAYMPWGLAEEAAASVAWLERHGIDVVRAYVALLDANDGTDPAELAPDLGRDKTGQPAKARICPIMAGSYVSDLRGTNLTDGPLEIENMNAPILLVPFLVWVARDLGCSLSVQWGRVHVLVSGEGIEVVTGSDDLAVTMPQDVAISVSSDTPKLSGIVRPRTDITDQDRMELERFFHRTLLPESETSKSSGAGGNRIDDE
jgi:hypothetical protein